jgi:DNA recombination protein RmuC
LAASREQHTKASAALAAAEANENAAQRLLEDSRNTYAESLRAAKEAQEKALADLRETFKALSADALKQSAPQFLQLANETLGKFQETAKGDLATRQQAIATLVQPLKEQLESYQKRLQQSESAQSQVLGEVKKQLEGLAQNSQSLSTRNLATAPGPQFQPGPRALGRGNVAPGHRSRRHESALRFQRANPVRRQETGPAGASAGRPRHYC